MLDSTEDILRRLGRIRIWTQGGATSPAKPLLLIWALCRLLRGEDRLVAYQRWEDECRHLKEFIFGKSRFQPVYPFVRLTNDDDIWELVGADDPVAFTSSGDLKIGYAKDKRVSAGFPSWLHERLTTDPALTIMCLQRVLEANFPPTLHDDILAAANFAGPTPDHADFAEHLKFKTYLSFVRQRDPGFRHRVLRAYEWRCAVCGYAATHRGRAVSIDAAHIHWLCDDGPSCTANGLALCATHHRLFDRGAFTIDDDLRVIVSREFDPGRSAGIAPLESGRCISVPATEPPGAQFLNWHRERIFC